MNRRIEINIKILFISIMFFCLFGSVFTIFDSIAFGRKIDKYIAIVDNNVNSKIVIETKPPNKEFQDLVRRKQLFGGPEIDLRLIGILGNSVLLGEEWYDLGIEKNGIIVISIDNDSAKITINGNEKELKMNSNTTSNSKTRETKRRSR
jgi:hypothetical protein